MTEVALRQRLAAILAADAASYSRLMAAALHAARALFREQIEANQSRGIDMADDSVRVVFVRHAGCWRIVYPHPRVESETM